MSVEDVARKLRIKPEKIYAWESGEALPSIAQLRKLARAYHQTFAAFYLPSPPKSDVPVPKDYRRNAGTTLVSLSPELALDIRTSWERREILLELFEEQEEEPVKFTATAELDTDPDMVAEEIRGLLGITYETQTKWKDPRIGLNFLREAMENAGVLVFQSTKVPVSEVRGYSLSEDLLPVVVVNRKDSAAARSFTLLHEITHVMLRSGGLCDLQPNGEMAPEATRVEVFCNHVAGAALVPKELLLNELIVQGHASHSVWVDEDIEALARIYSVSREVIARRLLILGLTTSQFYESKRKQYQEEKKSAVKAKGFPTPSGNLVSASGKPYVRAVLNAFYSERITSADVVDYLGVRPSHLDKVASLLGGGSSEA
jgi:Zn-dependent peptidase ImmA (M78 family)/DNA-binding XRE family transcriptional regulator